jgi:hypothetical protein
MAKEALSKFVHRAPQKNKDILPIFLPFTLPIPTFAPDCKPMYWAIGKANMEIVQINHFQYKCYGRN